MILNDLRIRKKVTTIKIPSHAIYECAVSVRNRNKIIELKIDFYSSTRVNAATHLANNQNTRRPEVMLLDLSN